MKKTQFTDALRNIWKQKISYLSIVVIAALGVTMFLGIDYSSAAIRKNGSDYYNEANFRDIEITATMLLTEDDLDYIRALPGVKDAEGVLVTNAKIDFGEAPTDASVVSLTKRLNIVSAVSGRLPENGSECAVERKLAAEIGIKPGDRLSLVGQDGGAAEYLLGAEFTVVGTVIHPDHASNSSPEAPYVIVTEDAFDLEALDGGFMKCEITLEKETDALRFADRYREQVEAVLGKVDEAVPDRTSLRDSGIRKKAQLLIDEKQKLIDEAKALLEAARQKLDDGYSAYLDGKAEAEDSRRQLEDARDELDDAKLRLDDGKAELDSSKEELEKAKKKLDKGKKELEEGEAELEEAKRQLRISWNKLEDAKAAVRLGIRAFIESASGQDTAGLIKWADRQRSYVDGKKSTAMDLWITEDYKLDLRKSLKQNIVDFIYSDKIPEKVLRGVYENLGIDGEYDPKEACEALVGYGMLFAGNYEKQYNKLASSCKKWDSGHKKYLEGKEAYEAACGEYDAALKKYNSGKKKYEDAAAEYDAALAEYEDGERRYADSMAKLETAENLLRATLAQLEAGEKEYADGLLRLDDGNHQIEEAVEKIKELPHAKWITMDVNGNTGFVQLGYSGSNLKSLEMTFSLLFVVVGALVIYATISKMIDEQRSLVGTTKALGFFNREIFAKYLMFGVSATVLGAVIGTLLARLWVEGFILRGYNIYYNMNLKKPVLVLWPTVAVFAAGILLSVTATWLACSRLLRSTAIQLMQPSVPAGKKRSGSSRHMLSLYSRLILLNMRTDLKRVIVTVVSVAGCCSLIVIGFTLKNAVNGSVRHQFGEIVQYDGCVKFAPREGADTAAEIEAGVKQAGAEACPVQSSYITVRFRALEIYQLYVGDLTRTGSMFRMLDVETGNELAPSDEGIFVPRRFSEVNKKNVGDEIEIALNGIEAVKVKIVGVFENYMDRSMFMSCECFSRLFGREYEPNICMVQLNGVDLNKLCDGLRSVDGYENWRPSDEFRKLFNAATSVMNAIVALFIVMAAIMAGVVLMNLTNIYIMQKKRELTIMRINGFTVNEVIGYVSREAVITTVLGIIIGIVFGSFIAYSIIRALEQPFIQFDRGLCPAAWAIGAAITAVFALIVNIIALRKVRKLKLTDLT